MSFHDLGTIIFAQSEGWEYLDSTYFCLTSLLKVKQHGTLGLVDISEIFPDQGYMKVLEVGAIIWPKKKTFHGKLSPILVLSPILFVRFLCVTKQQMLVQVFRVLQKNIC